MSIVARGLGIGAAAIIVTAGLGLAQQVEQPQAPLGGGSSHAAQHQRAPIKRPQAGPIAALQQEAQALVELDAERQAEPLAAVDPAAPDRRPQSRPAGAPIASQATPPVPAAPGKAVLARSEQAAEQIQAPAIAADAAPADEDAAERQKDRQRRIAIALALLMLNDA